MTKIKCSKCGGDMVWKQRPENAASAGKPKGSEVGRDWYCKKCQKYLNKLKINNI